MASRIKNCFLVNAPAGSGKTTKIKAMIKEHSITHPKDNILCITYTNRAVDELLIGISSKNIFISTIHSFLNKFISPYFSYREALDLYFELFGDKIKKIINSQSLNIIENNRYKEKYGEFSYESVKRNLTHLYYNELQFNSLLYGGLSHDSLISFAKSIVKKYPIIKKRIASKYQLIFIDEYQDTSAEILELFYESTIDSNTKLYLFGDRMQQIYKNRYDSFELKLALFDKSEALNINRRSSPTIIDLLNKIYNDSNYIQHPPKNREYLFSFTPELIICQDIEKKIDELKEKNKDFIILYLLNTKRFSSIGAGKLFSIFSHMEKYKFWKKNNIVDVFTSDTADNPDMLMKLLFLMISIYESYNKQCYGPLIQELKKYPKIINHRLLKIQRHEDKLTLDKKLKSIALSIKNRETIDTLLTTLHEDNFIEEDYLNKIKEDTEYETIFDISLNEVLSLYNYLRDPKVSTQHGVKGESHESVIFVADDSSNLQVKMYDFFSLWSKVNLSLSQLQELYYTYFNNIVELESNLGFKLSDLNSDRMKKHKELLGRVDLS
ncbi:UvrD-helicase domain-containing protein [Gilliamella sp. Gris1-4]|uniref:UvrD-helicase domain-containing protein n=1 Tax=Gilliamella sp. Gris1-4 TaxID=3120244 RepID=UPI00080D90F5|nr:UvrD-helicase domain-containing protein [Gilliamella apicola]OCG37885.1 hypothetical protein A9G31_03185 [Gilliamella apicola]